MLLCSRFLSEEVKALALVVQFEDLQAPADEVVETGWAVGHDVLGGEVLIRRVRVAPGKGRMGDEVCGGVAGGERGGVETPVVYRGSPARVAGDIFGGAGRRGGGGGGIYWLKTIAAEWMLVNARGIMAVTYPLEHRGTFTPEIKEGLEEWLQADGRMLDVVEFPDRWGEGVEVAGFENMIPWEVWERRLGGWEGL